MSTEIARAPSQARPEPANETARALVKLLDRYGPSALATADDISRALLIAEGVKAVREVVKQAAASILPLQGSSLGFRTDKDAQGGYPEAVVVECATEALLRGLRLTGNEWNIIGGRCYVAQAGCARLVSGYPGLTDLEHAPGVPVASNGGAIVEYTMRWRLDGVPMEMTRRIPVRVNANMGMDAILGKAKRKMLAAVYERLTGSVLSEGEPEEALPPAPRAAEPKPSLVEFYSREIRVAETLDDLRVVVHKINADINSNRLAKDENRLLTAQVTERKAALVAAAAQEGEQRADFPPESRTPPAAPSMATNTVATATTAAPSTPDSDPATKAMPAAERRTEPPRQPDNFAGGDISKRITELLCGPTGLDWTQVRDDRLGSDLRPSDTGGLAKHCGFVPSATLKVRDLAPGAALKLYELLKGLANEKQARREKRAAGKVGAA